jgi:hypothetical protein
MYGCDKYKEKRVWGNIISTSGSLSNESEKIDRKCGIVKE